MQSENITTSTPSPATEPFGEFVARRQAIGSGRRFTPAGAAVATCHRVTTSARQTLATELAQSLQAQGLAACGEVLSALDRKSVEDLATTWAHLCRVLRLQFQPITIVVGPWWGEDPWARLSSSVIEAMCHAGQPTATVKWVSADAAVQAWIRQERG
jgi:hypothetical protein